MEYKLPPLPEPAMQQIDPFYPPEAVKKEFWFSAQQMRDYAIAAIEAQGVPDEYDALWNALQRIDNAACSLPWFKVAHEGGIDAVAQNIIDAMLASTPPAPQAERKPLFADLIANHDGLAEELKAIDAQIDKEHGQASVVQQEPVAKIVSAGDVHGKVEWLVHSGRPIRIGQVLYTHPAPQAKPQPLSDDQMWKLWNAQGSDDMSQKEAIAFARAIEAAHGIQGS